jgi:fumarylacetoacetase
MPDHTHDAGRRSWVASAAGHAEFPLQNLPFGIVSPNGAAPRGGVAIGDAILDLPAALEAELFTGAARSAAEAAAGPTLNPLFALPAVSRAALRARLFDLLAEDAPAAVRDLAPRLLHDAAACALLMPASVGDFTDFYAGINHATNTGRMLRPDAPLAPNYKFLPVAYTGRASSVRASGEAVRRPNGQRKPSRETVPTFGPSRNLDYELELGIWVGPGNVLGEPIPIADAHAHIAGYCLLNDWSARDIQGWESQPMGPLMGKNFLTTVSPWVVTPEALRPFRIAQAPRPEGDPAPLPYLFATPDQQHGALEITLEVLLATAEMRRRALPPQRVSLGSSSNLYWTCAQMIAHHASNGCDLRPGDLFGSGTISGDDPGTFGSLLEISEGGRKPTTLTSGETRRFLEDGDEVIFRAHAHRTGFATIGFGECRGVILPAA